MSSCTPQDRIFMMPIQKFIDLPWTQEEKDLVAQAWDPAEAWENHLVMFGQTRSFGAIKMEWYRAHPEMPNHHTQLEKMIKQALDALEIT